MSLVRARLTGTLSGSPMDAAEYLANYYDALIRRCDSSGRPDVLPRHDQAIYYIISTRCEMDMNGFDSVFDQLLTEKELLFLIEALNEVGASDLAHSFARAHSRLKSASFFDDESMMVWQLENSDTETGFLEDIEEEIRKNDILWELDDRLVELIPTNAR